MLTEKQILWLAKEFSSLAIDEQKRWFKFVFKDLSFDEKFDIFLRLIEENEALKSKVDELESYIDYYERALSGISDD